MISGKSETMLDCHCRVEGQRGTLDTVILGGCRNMVKPEQCAEGSDTGARIGAFQGLVLICPGLIGRE